MDLLWPIELLLLVVVDGVRHLAIALRKVDIEDGLSNTTWRRNNEVEGSRHTLMHADICQTCLLAVRCRQILEEKQLVLTDMPTELIELPTLTE